jgi:hypothetical protein
MAGKFQSAPRWLACAALSLLIAGESAARAADTETREFAVLVDSKPAGSATIGIQRQDDGNTVVSCETKVEVRVLIKRYVYTCQSREVWKEGRLREFGSNCYDDGKRYQVSAAAQPDGVHVRVNGRERTIKPEVWLSSYWTLPDAKLRNQVVPVLDADNGRDLQFRIQHIGATQMAVAGQMQNVEHYRLTGSKQVDLWYDASERLVREAFVEDGHPTVLELTHIRR